MKEISFKDRDAIFGRLEELASRGNMSKEGRAEGRSSEKNEIAKKMKAKSQPTDFIVDITGLTIEEIEKL